MHNTNDIDDSEQPHDKLGIKFNSTEKPYVSADIQQKLIEPRRLSSYFIVLVESGSINYKLDLQDITVTTGQLLFAMPNQVFTPPDRAANLKYFKVLFDENTLALLPQQFPFLANPLTNQKVILDDDTKQRVQNIFEILRKLLQVTKYQSDTEIVLAYLNALLTELNSAYFKNRKTVSALNTNLGKYIEFKLVVETHLVEQPSINSIAEKLALSTNSLYRIVKDYSGVSPKNFLTNRLMVEAQRKLLYSNLSVKELAYELGFNDADYFSKLFKKCTGKNVTEFLDNTQDLSGK